MELDDTTPSDMEISTFPGTDMQPRSWSNLWASASTPRMARGSSQARSRTLPYSTWLHYGLSAALDGVAASLSQLALSGNETVAVPGTGTITETYVHVRFYWLVLPLGLEVGSVVFLTIAVIQSRRGGLRPWKASLLPLLFHSLEQLALAQLAVPGATSALSGIADRFKDRLGRSSLEKLFVPKQI